MTSSAVSSWPCCTLRTTNPQPTAAITAKSAVPTRENPSIRPRTTSPVRTGLVITVWIAFALKSAGRLKTERTRVTKQTKALVAKRMNPR